MSQGKLSIRDSVECKVQLTESFSFHVADRLVGNV